MARYEESGKMLTLFSVDKDDAKSLIREGSGENVLSVIVDEFVMDFYSV